MAHFSKDYSLIKLLTSPQADVFTMIAAKWSEKHESSVSSQDRDQTKRLVYGILYGMGPNTLAEQLDCSADAAAERIQNFKKSFPGVASWLQEAVTSCHKKGWGQYSPNFHMFALVSSSLWPLLNEMLRCRLSSRAFYKINTVGCSDLTAFSFFCHSFSGL